MLLGKRGKDKITGFEGIITGRAEYHMAPSIIQISAKLTTGAMSVQWIEEERVEIIEEAPAQVPGEEIVYPEDTMDANTLPQNNTESAEPEAQAEEVQRTEEEKQAEA